MISEHRFASSFTSVWHEITPLADGFWNVENLMVERILVPLKNRVPSAERGLVNELAFRAFALLAGSSRVTRMDTSEAIEEALPETVAYLNRITLRTGESGAVEVDDITVLMKREAAQLALRLTSHFVGSDLTLRPIFPGCGIISQVEGDLIQDGCLYEIKAGDRNFRSVDLRQLLVYAALEYASPQIRFEHVGLFNPRTGQHWKRTLDDVCREISGLRSADVLSRLVAHFSAETVSR